MKTRSIIIIIIISSWCLHGTGSNAGIPDNDLKRKALIILENKCNSCHSSRNPGRVFNRDNMEVYATKIYRQVFVKRRMPKGNAVKLTKEEQEILMHWLETRTLARE